MSTGPAATSSGRSILKGALQGTAIYSIPLLAQRVASIFLLSIVVRVLTTEDFGMLSLLEQVNSILSILLCANMSAALGYFYFQEDTEEHRNRVVGTTVGGAFLIGVVGVLIYLPFMGVLAQYVFRSRDALRYLPIVFATMPLNFALEAVLAWLRVIDRQVAFAAGGLLRLALTVAGIGILVGIFKFHVMGYLATTLGTLVLTLTVLVVYMFRQCRPSWSFPLFWKILRFAAPLGLSWIAMFVVNFGDQFVLRQYRSFTEVGLYSLAYRIGMLVAIVYGSFNSYWSAQIYSIMRRDDADTVFARLFTYCNLLLAVSGIALIVGSGPGLRILVTHAYWPAAPLIPLLVAANWVRAIGEFLRTRFLAQGRPTFETYSTWGGMAICVALYFLLIPRLGMWGAAIATFLTFLVMAAGSVLWTYHTKPYHVEGVRLVKLAIVIGVILFLYYTVPVPWLPAQIAWSAFLFLLLPAGLWLLRFPTPGEWGAVRTVLQRIAGAGSALSLRRV